MDSDRLTPTLGSLLGRMHDARQQGLHVSLPGRVESYDADRQAATVKPLLLRGTSVDGTRRAEELGVIHEVPVLHAGGGGFRLTFPVAVGDTVLVVFMETSVDRWLQLGGLVDPGDDRRHDVNDAVAVTGLRDFAHPLGDAPTDAWSLGKDGGPAIEGDDSVIAVGGRGGAEPTILGESFFTTVPSGLATFLSDVAALAGALAALTAPSGALPDPTTASAASALQTQAGNFGTALSGYLTTIAKVV